MSLFCALSRIAEQIQQQRHLMNNEEATLQVSIRPFIEALGYNTRNLSEVAPQFTADPRPSGTDRVDYAILRDNYPVILIEAKSANTSLTENNWKQLHDYFNAEEVRLGILTNGLEYRFYTDLKKRNIMDKQPFLIIEMLSLDERLVTELESFTKSAFDSERILSSARKLVVVRLLENEYRHPTTELAGYFAKQVYPGRLSQSIVEEFMPIFRQAWTQFVVQQTPIRPQPVVQTETAIVEDMAKLTADDMMPSTLLTEQSGKIPVYANWRGHAFEATLAFDKSRHRRSRVTFGRSTATPSKTALEAIRSIVPDFKAINGWDFWKLRDPNGNQERSIGDLRNDAALLRRLLGNT